MCKNCAILLSLPAWECGLKYLYSYANSKAHAVTPCVGVWIEIKVSELELVINNVTPCVGVWIEIYSRYV